MGKIKELWGKNKKIILIVLFLLFLTLLLIFTKGFGLFTTDSSISSKVGSYDLNEVDSFSYVWDFENEKPLTVFGIVSDMSTSSFILKDPEGKDSQIIVYFVNPLNQETLVDVTKISVGDYVVAEGKWDTDYTSLIAEKITKIEEDFAKDFLASKIPILDIEILEYPKRVSHSCETLKFKLRLTNTGEIAITHSDLYDRDYGYSIYHFIDDTYTIANSEREDYAQVKEDLDDYTEIGLLSNLGFLYFEDIQPGQSRAVEYWGGGRVTESLYPDMFNDDGSNRRAGISGEENIFGRKEVGEYSFSFAWTDNSSWDSPEFLSRSNVVNIKFLDNSCHNTEENVNNTFWVEPL
jgi:hypothetical protein